MHPRSGTLAGASEDAMTDLDPANHAHSVEKIFPRIGETTTTQELPAALDALPGD